MPDTQTTYPRGAELLRQAVNRIIEHPEEWDQEGWHSECGTKHCLAGHMQIMGGRPAIASRARSDAAELGELSEEDSIWLSMPYRTLTEIRAFTEMRLRGLDYWDDGGFDPDTTTEPLTPIPPGGDPR